jgi:DNA-binding transcriptional ArsR family regulator
MSQFIGQTNSDGRLTGLLADLRFVQMLEETEDRIILTEQGWRFAALSNPVLDGSFGDHRDGLSGDEVSYLIHHIVDFVPEERSAYKTLLKHIREGSDTPRKLDLHLKSSLSRQKKGDLSDSFLSSQRSAAISRMVELGLVKREREGVYVRYLSTESGNHLLNRLMTESGQP